MFKQASQTMATKQQRIERAVNAVSRRLSVCCAGACLVAAAAGNASTAAAATYTWANATTNSNWNDTSATGWNTALTTNLYPSLAGDVANLSIDLSTGTKTTSLNVSGVKLGTLAISDAGSGSDSGWNVTTTDAVNNFFTFETTAANALLRSSSSTTNTVAVPLVLNNNLTVDVVGTALSLTGAISGNAVITKTGGGYLTLSTTNSYTGGTSITSGAVRVSGTNQSLGTGSVVISGGGELRLSSLLNINTGGGATVKLSHDSNAAGTRVFTFGFDITQAQLDSLLTTDSTGVIAVGMGGTASTQALDMAALGDGTLFLGAAGTTTNGSATNTYGASTLGAGADNTYRLGGGFANLGTLVITNAALVENSGTKLIVGQVLSNGGGVVRLQTTGTITGTTTIDAGTLELRGSAGSLALSDVTANGGTTLTFDATSGGTGLTRVSSLRLNRATLNLNANAAADTVETITNSLILGTGTSTITVNGTGSRNHQLSAGSLTHNLAGSTVLFRGLNLGTSALAANTASVSNIGFVTSPTAQMVGGGGAALSNNISILPFAIGGTTAASTGTSFVTHDANGIRLLDLTNEYAATFSNSENLTSNINVGATGVTGIDSATTINSLLLTGAGGVQGTGTLAITSGAVWATAASAIGTTLAPGTLDFGSREGFIGSTAGTTTISNSGLVISHSITGTAGLTMWGAGRTDINGVIGVSGGVVFNGSVGISGTSANTYTGPTIINSGTVTLAKTAGLNAITGDVTINGGTLAMGGNFNQIADSANVTVNGTGSYAPGRTETINSLTLNDAGTLSFDVATNNMVLTMTTTTINDRGLATAGAANTGTINFGTLVLNGGTVAGFISGNPSSSQYTAGNITINHRESGAYSPITFAASTSARSTFTFNGDFTFNRDLANTNSFTATLTEGGTAGQSSIVLGTGTDHTFTIANGQAEIDVSIAPRITGAAKNLIKSGAGTLQLTGVSSYSGTTTVNEGRLLADSVYRLATSQSGTCTNGSGLITGLTDTSGLVLGQVVSGTGISGVITSINSATSINVSSNVSGGGTKTVTFGALSSTGTSAVIVNGGTLGGNGGIVGAVTVNAGVVNPGVTGTGTLTTGSVTFADGSTLNIDLSGSNSDRLVVVGDLDLQSLSDTLVFAGVADGGTYTLATYTGALTGTFDTAVLPTFNSTTYTINYGDGTNDAITISVPEPGSLSLLGLAVGGLLVRRKRR